MTSSPTVLDQELEQFGWVESLATNSISDFKSTKSNIEEKEKATEKKSDLVDIFICHLIFYLIFCYSLFLYIFFDLGLGSFIKNKLTKLINFKERRDISIPLLN
tara:strand:+ start:498 stop:809 length:312 start_codon:yes stop_codon:yes gene_type:complete